MSHAPPDPEGDRSAPDERGPRECLADLRAVIARSERMLVAFSGGVDSALLAWVAHDVLGDAAVAVTAVSASLADSERRAAAEFCRQHGMDHLEICTDELQRADYVRNGADRCFHCKSALLDALTPLSRLTGADVALGTNLDDLRDHRPGQAAAAARGAIAPLVSARLTKAQVRSISASLNLSTADKPAAACLASRIAYGDPVTPQLLAAVEAAEAALHRLGFAECRVRAHAKGTVARVEVPVAALDAVVAHRSAVIEAVRGAGFTYCTVDLAGLRSGSMNALLTLVARESR